MAISEQAPYAPTAAVVKVLETYRDTGLGGRAITTELVSKLSVGDSIAPRVVSTLQALDLISTDGQPTDALVAFKQAPSNEYRSVLAESLFAAYEPVFAITGRDLASKSVPEIEDAFRHFKPDSLRKRMVTLFVGLCAYAGIVTEAPAPTTRPGPKPRAVPRSAAKAKEVRGQKTPDIPTRQLPTEVVFGVSEADIAALSEEEFDVVWAALGTVARARARAKAVPLDHITNPEARSEADDGSKPASQPAS